MLNVYSQQENQRAALRNALSVYLYFRLKEYSEKNAIEETIKELVKRLHVSEDFAKQAIYQMWN